MKRIERDAYPNLQIINAPRVLEGISNTINILSQNPNFRANLQTGKLNEISEYAGSSFTAHGHKFTLVLHTMIDLDLSQLTLDLRRYPIHRSSAMTDFDGLTPKESYMFFGAKYTTQSRGDPYGSFVFVTQFTDGDLQKITNPRQVRNSLCEMLSPLNSK